jgi:uncharacterized protein YigE (DUF2233 family)
MTWKWPLLAAVVLSGCDGSNSDDDAAMRAETAAALSSACVSDEFEDVPLTHCVADPARHEIAVVLGPKGRPPYRGLSALADARGSASRNVAFAMNGGMYDPEGQPIGYHVERGKRLHRLSRSKGPGNFHMLPNGVFFGTENKWQVRTADDFADSVSERPEFATQSGPMLVIAGKLHPQITRDGESRHVRNAVGVDAKGRAHFVISEAPLSFGKLARYFRDELKVRNALYLDGNVSALWDPVMGRIDSSPPLGPLIVVEKRAMAPAESSKK